MSGAGPVAVALAQAIGLMMSATFIIYVLIIAVAYTRRRSQPPGTPGPWAGTCSSPR